MRSTCHGPPTLRLDAALRDLPAQHWVATRDHLLTTSYGLRPRLFYERDDSVCTQPPFLHLRHLKAIHSGVALSG